MLDPDLGGYMNADPDPKHKYESTTSLLDLVIELKAELGVAQGHRSHLLHSDW